MQHLSEQEYWDSVYADEQGRAARRAPQTTGDVRSLRSWARRYLHSYTDYWVWESLYRRFLPTAPGTTCIEIGSAPGAHLVRLQQTFGLVPYGVEYSPAGVELNRKLFAAHGLNPDNVIHADFFSEDFLSRHEGRFDVVLSRGFIEHFRDLGPVVDAHLRLLRKGGLLVVFVPNLRGVNWALSWLLNPESLRIHNTRIMKMSVFRRLFDAARLEPLFCEYFGGFDFGVFNARPGSPREAAMKLCYKAQLLLNLAYRLTLRNQGAANGWFGAYLGFVGTKK